MNTPKRKSGTASQVSKKLKVELPEYPDSFWIIVAKSMARTGDRQSALMLLSTRQSFQVSRRGLWMKYYFFSGLTPEKYFAKLGQLCVFRDLGFPMNGLKSKQLTEILKTHLTEAESKEEWPTFKTLHKLLCSNTTDLDSIIRPISRLTSLFSCKSPHDEEAHYQSILVRIFSFATKIENWQFASTIGTKIDAKEGALLSVYFQTTSTGEGSQTWRANFVKGIKQLPNFEQHNEFYQYVTPGDALDFSILDQRIAEDAVLSGKNKTIFFFSHLLSLYMDRKIDELVSVFDEYAQLYINPTPPTMIAIGPTVMFIVAIAFVPELFARLGDKWKHWLRANRIGFHN